MNVLKTAVIGLGRIGWQRHIPDVIAHPGFELTAVLDPLEERCREAELEFGVKAFTDFELLINENDLDLVVIASPTKFHAQQAIYAMKNGCDVFCDKPIAMDLTETDQMVAAAADTGQKLMVFQPHRATSVMVSLKSVLAENLIGPIFMIKRAETRYTRRNDWQAFKKNGGGMLANYGAHFLDQLFYLVDYAPVKRLSCELRTIASFGDADDVVKGIITTEDDIILDMDINMAAGHDIPSWQIFGKYGSIRISEDGHSWNITYYNPDDLPDLQLQDGLAAEQRQYGSGEVIPWQTKVVSISDFEPVSFYDKCYDYFALDLAPFVPIAQTRQLMSVIEQCRNSNQ